MYACSTNCNAGRQDAEKRSAENKATRTAESPGGRTKSNCRAANSPREKTVGKLGLLLQKKRFRASLNLPQQQQQQKQQQQQQHSIAAGEVLEGSARLSSLSLCQLLARSPGELLNNNNNNNNNTNKNNNNNNNNSNNNSKNNNKNNNKNKNKNKSNNNQQQQ